MPNPYETPAEASVEPAPKTTWNYRAIGRYALSALGVVTLTVLLIVTGASPSKPLDAFYAAVTVVPLIVWPRWYMVPLVAVGIAILLGAFQSPQP